MAADRLVDRRRTAMPPDVTDLDASFAHGPLDVLRGAYEAHGRLVFTFCQRSVGPDRAHDVTQEVFITAWRQRERFDPQRGPLPAWLIGIARNKVLEAARRGAFHVLDGATPDVGVPSAPDIVDGLADRLLLADALEHLPPRMRALISLAFDEELTHAQIADRTGLPLGTVKSDIRRGLQRLRRHLDRAHD
jgi:RNA polymerase sigma-70 factor (ECF subfamily)